MTADAGNTVVNGAGNVIGMEGFFHGSAVALLLMMAAIFMREGAGSAKWGAAFSLCGSVYASGVMAASANAPVALQVALQATASAAAPLLFLFARSWMDDRTPTPALVASGLAYVSVGLLHVFVLKPESVQAGLVSGWLYQLGGLAFAIATIFVALRGRQTDLVEARRRVRFRFLMFSGVAAGWVSLSEPAARGSAELPLWNIATTVSLSAGAAWLLMGLIKLRQADLFGPPKIVEPDAASSMNLDPASAARLMQLLKFERLYRDSGLTIGELAARLSVPEYRLRQHINGALGFRNFSAFLGSFRLGDAKTALADPEQANVPILTIALDAGYGSLAPFNRAFKEMTGQTPTEFRRSASPDSENG